MKKRLFTGVLAASIFASGMAYAVNQEFTNDINYKKGVISLNSNNFSDAIVELNKAIKRYPNIIEVKNNLVDAYFRRGTYRFNRRKDYKNAANDFRAAIYYLKYYRQPTSVDLDKVYIIESNLNNCFIGQKLSLDFKTRFKEAKKLRGQGLFKQAVVELHEAAKDQSIRAKSLEDLGDLMVIFKNNQKAADYYQNVVVIEPKNYDAHLKYARVLEKLGLNDSAIQEYNLAMQGGVPDEEVLPSLEKLAILNLKKYPDNAASYLNLGAVFQKKGDYVTSLNYYQKARDLDPNNPLIKLNIGSLYQVQGDYKKAIDLYSEVVKVHPYDKLAHLYRAQAYKSAKDYFRAINGFQTVLQIEPANKLAKAELLDTISNFLPDSQVLDYFEKAANQNNSDETIQFMYANELFKNKKYEEAITYYKRTIDINYQNINAYINIAKAYQELSDYNASQNIIEEGLAKNPKNFDLQAYKATVDQNKLVYEYQEASKHYNKGEFEVALRIYENVEKQNKDTFVNIAACYQAMNKFDQAIVYYTKALAEDDKDASVLYYLGTVNYSKNNYENANVLYKQALALDPGNEEVKAALKIVTEALNEQLLQKGLDFYNESKYYDSIKTLTKLIESDAKNAYGFYYRGLSYDAIKKQNSAVADYEKAVELLPTFDVAYYALAVDYDAMKNLSKAKDIYKKFLAVSKEENVYTKYAKERLIEIEEQFKAVKKNK